MNAIYNRIIDVDSKTQLLETFFMNWFISEEYNVCILFISDIQKGGFL